MNPGPVQRPRPLPPAQPPFTLSYSPQGGRAASPVALRFREIVAAQQTIHYTGDGNPVVVLEGAASRHKGSPSVEHFIVVFAST